MNFGRLPGKIGRALGGELLCSLGTYLTIVAGIGIAPWDALSQGISRRLGISFGTAMILTSAAVLAIDLIMKEKIGLGTILDITVGGVMIDLYTWLGFLHDPGNPILGTAMLVLGIAVTSLGQALYMGAGLGCGPRDALLVALGKHLRRVPIGAVSLIIYVAVICAGWALGGSIGLGTVITVLFSGAIMQLIFRMVRFEPRRVSHQSMFELLHARV